MTRGLHWFRNDLRLQDNTALDALADRAEQWLGVFVLDPRLVYGPRAGSPRLRDVNTTAWFTSRTQRMQSTVRNCIETGYCTPVK